MLLTIDIGNTNITFGVYDEQNQLKHHWRIKTDHGRMADEYGIIFLGLMRHEGLRFQQIRGVAMASVVPRSDTASRPCPKTRCALTAPATQRHGRGARGARVNQSRRTPLRPLRKTREP